MNMYDRHHITKILKLVFNICLLLVLSACSNNDDSAAKIKTETVTEIPQFIQKLALNNTDGHLEAWITIDKGTAEEKTIEMTIVAGTASTSISGLSRSTHTVLLEFKFTNGIDTVTLATATSTVGLSTDNDSLSFVGTQYKKNYDDDGDGISNLDEVKKGTNPTKIATWGLPALASLGGLANYPSISLDGVSVVALWGEGNSGDAGSSIITKLQAGPETIATGLTTKPHFPASTTTSTGNSIAVWMEEDELSGLDILCALIKVSGGGWQTTPQCNLDDGSGNIMFPQIVPGNLDGSAFVAYEQNDTIQGIFFNGNTWTAAQQISSSGRNLNVGSNGKGTIVVAWRGISAGDYMIHATVWSDANAAWSTTKLLDTDQTGATLHAGKDAFDPAVSVNASGDVLVTWRQEDASAISQPWSNSYDGTTGTWASAQQIADSQNGAFHVRPHLDNNGKYSAVYREYDSTAKIASLYLASGQSSVWAESTQLVPEENKISSPNIIGDGINIRFISWIANDVNNNETFMAKRNIGTVWYTSERADDNSVGDVITDTEMVMDISTGIVDAIWIQTNTMGSSNTILNTFK